MDKLKAKDKYCHFCKASYDNVRKHRTGTMHTHLEKIYDDMIKIFHEIIVEVRDKINTLRTNE